jgi:DNA-directed RNA polymerase specialized sigma24 family protein
MGPSAASQPGEAGKAGRIALERAHREHAGSVYAHAYRLTGNPHDAADLTQHAFVKVFGHLGRIRRDEALGG